MHAAARGPTVAGVNGERRQILLTEVAPALLLAAFVTAVTPLSSDAERHELDAFAYVLCVGAGLGIGLWRRAPLLAYAIPLAAVIAYTLLEYPGGPIYAAGFAATLVLVAQTPPRVWLPAIAVGGTGLAVAHLLSSNRPGGAVGAFAVWVVAAVLFGEVVRVRRAKLEAAEQRAAWAERTRAEEARRQVAEERLRIARDVHDIVGHSLATITLQAGVAEHLLDERPDQARAAVAAIRRVGKQSMAELQGLLGPLRAGDDAPRAPAPDLRAIGALADEFRSAGLPVQVEASGDAAVPELVGVAGYRIAQAALTNVARHAGAGATARVLVATAPDAVVLEVADDGVGAPAGTREGNGLTGMRERAAAVGGTLEAGSLPGGGYRVRAELPLR
jgi:signal transduction histidine kinase